MSKLKMVSKRRPVPFLLFTAAAATALSPSVAQVRPGAGPAAGPTAAQAQPAPAAQPPAASAAPPAQPQAEQAAPAPPPLPPVVWDLVSAEDLLRYIQQVGGEGLNPADYDPAGLQAALQSGDPAIVSAAATERFNRLSSALALGHVKRSARIDWFMPDPDLDAAKQDALLRSALAARDVTGALNGLLPTHPQYAALKTALEATPAVDKARRDKIRLNLDRWRWLPRDLGSRYIIVNVPGFHATLVENGVNRWKQRAIAGSVKTPTPQLSALATGVVLNPWWEVPPSIAKEVAGKAGYVAVKGADGKVQRWRQPPGPNNALGQMKFVMYNPHNIYLHDTNARSRFNSQIRALSHGCIRTQHIHDLAAELGSDNGGEWNRERIDRALATGKTIEAKFVKPVPVYIVYFSQAALVDGRIVDYKDLYARDAKAMAALNMADGGASLSKAKTQVASK
ncbi:MAG TPA: L,D-transpeptidase family protein [Sphingomicrobium sp.]|nr:L,D-transpeptidase family protein [Sphingomicrobium sp.]